MHPVNPAWDKLIADFSNGSSVALESIRNEFIHPLRFLSYVVTQDMGVSKLIVNSAILDMWVFRQHISDPKEVKIFLYEEVARSSFLYHLKNYWGISDKGEQTRIWNQEGECIKEVIRFADEYQAVRKKIYNTLRTGTAERL